MLVRLILCAVVAATVTAIPVLAADTLFDASQNCLPCAIRTTIGVLAVTTGAASFGASLGFAYFALLRAAHD
jgi:hypothetical protein